MPSYLTHCPANFWGGVGGWGMGGVIYILVPSPLASNIFLHHILIFGVRPLVIFPFPFPFPPPRQKTLAGF